MTFSRASAWRTSAAESPDRAAISATVGFRPSSGPSARAAATTAFEPGLAGAALRPDELSACRFEGRDHRVDLDGGDRARADRLAERVEASPRGLSVLAGEQRIDDRLQLGSHEALTRRLRGAGRAAARRGPELAEADRDDRAVLANDERAVAALLDELAGEQAALVVGVADLARLRRGG